MPTTPAKYVPPNGYSGKYGVIPTPEQVRDLGLGQLRIIVRSTNPDGKYAAHVVAAREEIARRDAVDARLAAAQRRARQGKGWL